MEKKLEEEQEEKAISQLVEGLKLLRMDHGDRRLLLAVGRLFQEPAESAYTATVIGEVITTLAELEY